MKEGGEIVKTKITMLNGDQHILDGHPMDFINKIQNGHGKITIESIDVGSKSINTHDIVTCEIASE